MREHLPEAVQKVINHKQDIVGVASGSSMIAASTIIEVGNIAQAVGFILGCIVLLLQIFIIIRDKIRK